jgi:hypothetical protein
MNATIGHKTDFRIVKRRCDDPSIIEVDEWSGNLGLNEGINLMTSLLCGGAGTVFSNANAYIGVGDSTTAVAATQTGLQAATNKAWSAMEATYPTFGTNQQVVFNAIFGSGEANFAWNEFTTGNSATGAGVDLLRSVASKGTKVAGEEWEVTITVTFS